MNRDEEVSLRLVGDGGAGFKRDESVVAAGIDDVGAKALFEEAAEAKGYIEDDVFLSRPPGPRVPES